MATTKIKIRPSKVTGKEGTLYFRVIHERVSRQIGTGYKLYPYEWEDGWFKHSELGEQTERSRYLLTLEEQLKKDKAKLDNIIHRLDETRKPYTAMQIVEAFLAPENDEGNIRVFVCELAHQLKHIGKERLAETYTTSVNSLMRFRGRNGDVRFDEIDADMMMEYEAYLKGQGLIPNTISFYMRNLRAIYNRAVRKNLTINRSPFQRVYTGIDKTVKRAIPLSIIRRIKKLDLSSDAGMERSRDLFFFSLYTRGMSFVDMAHLKMSDLQHGILTYRRQKTGQQLFIKWEKLMQDIVNRCRGAVSPYMLPIITLPGYKERRQYLNAIQVLNRHLKIIGKMVGCPIPLTSYVARHGWASIAKSQHIPIATISEAMGHDSEKTTRIYLTSLDTSVIDKANSKVIHAI